MKFRKETNTNKESNSKNYFHYFLLFCLLTTLITSGSLSYAQSDSLDGLYLELQTEPQVLIQENNQIITQFIDSKSDLIPNDPLYPEQWHLHQSTDATTINWEGGFQLLERSGVQPEKDIRIAVIDTGINAMHPDLQANIDMISGCSFIQDDSCEDAYSDSSPTQHGTSTTGILAGISNNGLGMAGTSHGISIEVTPFQVIQDSGFANYSDISEALEAVLADGNFDVVSINLAGWPNPDSMTAVNQIITEIAESGTILVAGSGNDGLLNTGVGWPANHPDVIAVGGTNRDGQRRPSASYGSELDISAPADFIGTLCYEESYCYQSGTSFSGPQVAAASAIIKAYLPNSSVADVRDILHKTAQGQKSLELGSGLLDFEAIAREILLTQKSFIPLLLK